MEALLHTVHLADLADRRARVLSRGQKPRLGLARALVNDPSVVLLDEPTSGLDPRSRIELRDILRSLAAQGRTLLVSSHILTELWPTGACTPRCAACPTAPASPSAISRWAAATATGRGRSRASDCGHRLGGSPPRKA